MRRPEARASSNIFGLLASTGALPGRLIPSASTTMCIEFAVPMPAHTPGPPMAWSHMPRERLVRELAEHRLHRSEEHVFDVDVLARRSGRSADSRRSRGWSGC